MDIGSEKRVPTHHCSAEPELQYRTKAPVGWEVAGNLAVLTEGLISHGQGPLHRVLSLLHSHKRLRPTDVLPCGPSSGVRWTLALRPVRSDAHGAPVGICISRLYNGRKIR